MIPIRVAIVLPGLHRVNRGAEVAFEAIGRELARTDGFRVTLFGSGDERPDEPYAFKHVRCVARERFRHWPRLPMLRGDTAWEELSFVLGLSRVYRAERYDVTIACSFPWTNLWLRKGHRELRPRHIFVTQNGDWPCHRTNSEYRWFGCDALVCTNPGYYDAHKDRYEARLIPNGVDPHIFKPGPAERDRFGLPLNRPVVLMVSALIPSKRVVEGIHAVSQIDSAFLLIAGDGPLRAEVDKVASRYMPGRFKRVSMAKGDMPALYRSVDVLLHMSPNEPFGNVYIEAMACGIPVVAHGWSATRWMLGDSATLVDTTNEQAVVDALRSTMRAIKQGECLRKRVVPRFDWQIIGQHYAELVRWVCSAQRSGSFATVRQHSERSSADHRTVRHAAVDGPGMQRAE